MKKLFSAALSLVLLLTLATPAAARDQEEPLPTDSSSQEDELIIDPIPDHSSAPEIPMVRQIIVNGEALDVLDLPVDFYREGEVTMVPLRRIAEALGLTVGWDPETGDITVEDPVQKAVLHNGSAEIIFTGKLKVIDLSHESAYAVPVTILGDGCTYVPLSFFEEFFQTVEETAYSVTITTHMYQLDEA